MNTSMDTIREIGLSQFFKSSMNHTLYAKIAKKKPSMLKGDSLKGKAKTLT